MNPFSVEMMKTFYTYKALKGMDENCAKYIEMAAELTAATPAASTPAGTQNSTAANGHAASGSELQKAIISGRKERAGDLTQALLQEKEPLTIVQEEIIPALDIVGQGYEEKRVYLPQLLMSAEAAKSAFEKIKEHMANAKSTTDENSERANKKIILATVHGDIHDIGKNIVKLLLENYGFDVRDLGKDVPPEKIVEMPLNINV